jgi:6,7-dimethyl-8-ribityllumazine synthase
MVDSASVHTLESTLDGRGMRIAVVVSRFNHPISWRLLEGCRGALEQLRAEPPDVMWVPGAFEIPLVARTAAQSGRYTAVIALGAVIRGGTPHFDYICRAVTDGCREAGAISGVPVIFGVLTTDSVEQALERAAHPGEAGSNQGAEAAAAAVEMASLLARLRAGS